MMCHFMGLPAFAPDALLRFQLRTALKVRGDIGEIQGRYRGDTGEIQGRYRGDIGEIQGRYRGDTGEI